MTCLRKAPLLSQTSVPGGEKELSEAGRRRFLEMDRRQRRRVVVRAVITISVTWVVLIAMYYLMPVGTSGRGELVRLVVGLAVVVVVLIWQVREILRADFPGFKAVEALAVIVPLFLLVFSYIYLSMSHSSSSTFSENLNHVKAMYFTVTVFSTVGFGDITPKTDTARIIVSVQMLIDLVIIGAGVRLLISAAKTGLARRQQPTDQD